MRTGTRTGAGGLARPGGALTRVAAGVVAALVLAVAPGMLVGTAASAEPTGSAQTWSIQPATSAGADGRTSWDLELEPGESVDDVAQVNNFGENPVTFRVYSHDALNAPDGAFTLQPADVEPAEVGAWIGLDEQVTVGPGDSALVPFTVTVPDDAEPGDHAGGIVASVLAEGVDANGQRVLVDNRVGSRVYLRVAGAIEPALEINGLSVDYGRSWVPFSSGDVSVSFDVRNTGNVRLSGEQSITGHGLFGLGEHTITLTDLPELLPGESVGVTARLEDVAPLFRETAEVTINPVPATGGTEAIPIVQAGAAATVWAMPWPELILLAALLLLGWWSWWRWRRGKRRAQAKLDEAVARARADARRELQEEAASPDS